MADLNIENACATSASKDVGTTALDAGACNLSSLDRAVNSSESTWTSRTGIVRDTIQGALNKLGVLYDNPIRGITPGLVVSDLRAHRFPVTTGDIYIPTAPLPFTTGASGSEFNADDWVILQGVTSQEIINDISLPFTFQSVAEYKASTILLPVGKTVHLNDRDADFLVISGTGTGNDSNIIASTSVNQSLSLSIINGIVTAVNLGMVTGVGQDNSGKLNSLNGFTFSEFVADELYEYTSNVTISKPNETIKIRGGGRIHGVNAFPTITGTTNDLGTITASAARGGRTIAVADASTLSVGDTVCIDNQNTSSFSQHNPTYTAGEYNCILSKSGNQLTLKNPLLFDYTSLANIKLFKINAVNLEHESLDFSVTGTSVFGLRVRFSNVNVYGKPNIEATNTTACAAALVYDKCPSVSYDLGVVSNDTAGTGTQYGLSFSSCWDSIGFVKSAYGYRHGVTTGGDNEDCSIQCNNIIIKDGSTISNNPASNIYAADFHGNTMNSYYRDCIIYGDIGLAGEDTGCPGSIVYAQRENYGIDLHEVVGGNIDISNTEIRLLPTFNFPEMVGFSSSGLSADVDRPFIVLSTHLKVECNSTLLRIFNLVYNQSAAVSGESQVDIDGVVLHGDTSGITEISRLVQISPGIRPSVVRIRNTTRLTDAQSYVVLSGNFQGCLMSLPSNISLPIPLTIAANGWFSTTGGTNGYAVHSFPRYPVPPSPSVVVENQIRAESPKIFPLVESVANNNVTAYISTDSDSTTITGGSTKNVRLQAVFENITLA